MTETRQREIYRMLAGGTMIVLILFGLFQLAGWIRV